MSLKVIEFPPQHAAQSVSEGLRAIADAIDNGEYGDAHNLSYVIDCGDSRIEIGLLGKAPEPALTAYFLFGLGKSRIEKLQP